MAKTSRTKNERAPSLEQESESQPDTSVPKYAAPEGYTKQTDDVAGFWLPTTGPLHFIPKEVRLSDSKIDEAKPSCLVIGELVDATELTVGDGEMVAGKPGDPIGVWYKPGMSALKELAGVKVFMFEDGELDTGKPSKMKLYEVTAAKKGGKLQVVADNRKKSRKAPTAFTEAQAGGYRGEVPDDEV